MSCEIVVFPAAGIGTRRMPPTSVFEKGLLPLAVGDRDLMPIDLMLDEVPPGMDVVMVTSRRGERQYRDYFEPDLLDPDIKETLTKQGEDDPKKAAILAEELARRHSYTERFGEFSYVNQLPGDGYGTAIPTYLALLALKEKLGGVLPDKMAVMGGDDFVRPKRDDDEPELALANEAWEASGTDHMIMGVPIERERAPHFGVLIPDRDDPTRLAGLIEKPTLDELDEILPGDTKPLVNISRYGFCVVKIWPHLERHQPHPDAERPRSNGNKKRNEFEITDVISDAVADGQTFHIHHVQAERYYDTGNTPAARKTMNQLTDREAASRLWAPRSNGNGAHRLQRV
jgi:UTP-glucose-1-phosphate uridylyltransferase